MSTFRTPRRAALRGRPRLRSLAVAAVAVLAAGVAVLGIQSAHAGIQGQVYVSPNGNDANAGTAGAPVKTLQRAQSLVRGLNQSMTADVTVVIADGFYRMSAPLTLSAADSGTGGHNVVWTADTGARPVLAGSDQITGWSRVSASSPIWVAQAPAGLQTRQLYVNGKRADRAHGGPPETLTGQNSSGYSGGGTTMGGWRNPSGAKPQLEFVYQGGLGAWTEPRCPVASIGGAAVTMAQPCWSNSTTRACCFADGRAYNLVGRQSITEQPTTVENAYQFLSASTPGQWFLDQGDSKLYYVPRAGENMGTADVEAPVLEKLVDGNGTASAPVHNIVFNGIQFSYATWLGPNLHGATTSDGFSEIQANYQVTGANGAASQGLCHVPPPSYPLGACPFGAWTQIPGNVSLTYDQDVQFTNDAFVHLGAAGLALGDGTQRALVKGNVVTDVSGNGIQLGNVDLPTATGSSQTLGNTVTDNHVFNVPAEYRGGTGIDSGYTASDTVSHNQIDNTPYTAVSQGWGGWPDKEQQAPQPNFSHDNAIANNLIFNHMLLLNDGGAIYTQGLTGTSLAGGEKVTGNVIHNQTGSGHAIYTDNGATYETIKGNAVYDNTSADAWASRHTDYHPGHTTTYDPTDVENNYFENPPGYSSGNGLTIANNTTIIIGASGVPASIMNAAGLETAYKGLLNWVQAPLPPVPGSGTPGITRYEAENGTCQGTIDSNHAGFSGTGFCNVTNAVGSTMTWTVNAATAGSATLTFAWANGTTVSRPTTITVNGGAAQTLPFPSTGTWESWTTSSVTVTLAAGTNTVTATSTTADGAPNLDYVDVAASSGGPITTRYEAENGTCQGTIDSNHAGFSGTGFCNVTNAVGSTMTWTVNAAKAGSATLTFGWANGTTVSRPTTITVNGGAAQTLPFPSTGTWESWTTSSVTVTLAAGTNTVTATSTTADGAPNLDYLDVTQ